MSGARFLSEIAAKRDARNRFTGEPPTGWGDSLPRPGTRSAYSPLQPSDSLSARMTRIWSPSWTDVLRFDFGVPRDDDESIIEWSDPMYLTRAEAARKLRDARACGMFIEKSVKGYEITRSL